MFSTPQQSYIAKSKYARYLDSEQRRETWDETVDRYMNFAAEHLLEKYPHAAERWNKVDPDEATSPGVCRSAGKSAQGIPCC